MYIRKVAQINRETNKEYHTYRLVASYRNSDGKARQQVLLNLGTHFAIPMEQWKQLADRIEEITNGQQTLVPQEEAIEEVAQSIAKRVIHKTAIAKKATIKEELDGNYHKVDINSLSYQQVRQIGPEHACLETLKQLDIDDLFKGLKFNSKQINTAIGSIVGRLVAPGSERATYKYLQNQSGLDELLGCDFQQLKLNNMYYIADKILQAKEVLEKKLFATERRIFDLEEVITLYDLTNTYFEGRNLANAKAAFGRSKEKRNDCPLVTLALVLDVSGFPKKSMVYAGNIGEAGTLAHMLHDLEETVKPTVVLDAGISSTENLAWLKANGYTYIVVSRKNLHVPADIELELHHKKDYAIKAKLIKNPETGDSELYCHSALKAEKEQGIRHQAFVRYETGLKKIAASLKKPTTSKKYAKILERLSRLKERYKYVAYTYDVQVITDNENKKVIDIQWEYIDGKQKPAGTYCLRSNRDALDEQTFWDIYIMLTELEAAFRCLKSELGLRPIYHQITKRVDSHIFISVLAYHILHTMRYKLKQHGIDDSWETIKRDLRTQCRITSTMKCEDGKKLHVRKTSLPTPRQLEIYRALKIPTSPCKTEKSIF